MKAIEVLKERLALVSVERAPTGGTVDVWYGPLTAIDVERMAFVALNALGIDWEAEMDEIVVLR